MQPVPGSLLIAPPSMKDTRFSKTVLLTTHNNSAGSFALCLNRPTKHNISELSIELGLDKELPFQMNWGGPVNPGSIWMIHDQTWEIENTLYVDKKWRVTSHHSMFYHLADGDAPRQFKIVFGFASWMPGQLDMELKGEPPFNKSSSWVVTQPVDPDWVFNINSNDLWDEATKLAGKQAVDTWMI